MSREFPNVWPLRETLDEWVPTDVAMGDLAVVLGLLPQGGTAARLHVAFHPVGKAMRRFLSELVEAGVLETRDIPYHQKEVRWNPEFAVGLPG